MLAIVSQQESRRGFWVDLQELVVEHKSIHGACLWIHHGKLVVLAHAFLLLCAGIVGVIGPLRVLLVRFVRSYLDDMGLQGLRYDLLLVVVV